MLPRDHCYCKSVWKKTVWEGSRVLEDAYWCLESKSHKSLELLNRIDSKCRYLNWWYLSDKFPTPMSMCGNLSKIVCQVSLLNSTNEFLKSLTRFARFCIHCD